MGCHGAMHSHKVAIQKHKKALTMARAFLQGGTDFIANETDG